MQKPVLARHLLLSITLSCKCYIVIVCKLYEPNLQLPVYIYDDSKQNHFKKKFGVLRNTKMNLYGKEYYKLYCMPYNIAT